MLRVLPRTIRGGERLQERETVLDSRLARHAAKKISNRSLCQHAGSKIDELPMNIVLRNRCCNAIDECGRHFTPFAKTSRFPQKLLAGSTAIWYTNEIAGLASIEASTSETEPIKSFNTANLVNRTA
jgi:hypothetical protein